MCRGLIVDDAGNIVSRPFEKFFNIEEMGEGWTPPAEVFEVTIKIDGSLGISFLRPDGTLNIATRGSFTSEQALHATEIFQARYTDLPWQADTYTYLFEILYPGNRIVVDYKGLDDIVLLAVLDTQTGQDRPLPNWFPNCVAKYDGITDLSTLKSLEKDNEEGFVIRFASGLRVKSKFAGYIYLHRLITGVTTRSIWEMLAEGKPIDELLQHVPEEFERWVIDTTNELQWQYDGVEAQAKEVYAEVVLQETRKDQATHPMMTEHRALSGIVFAMLDDKPYHHMIWKMIRPKAEKPFTKEEDE